MLSKLRYISVISLFSVIATTTMGQSSDEKAVTEVINRLFEGMTRSDSAMIRTTFAEGATLATVYRDNTNSAVLKKEGSIDGFLKAIAAPHTETYYEEIWNVKISMDGDFAHAWCDYAFYIGRKFNHCGVDSFHLYKSKDGWKIFHLADTRNKSGCNVPDAIQKKRQ